jgi:hypothetical protein
MAPLPIGTVIQTPTIPCAQRAHKSPLYLLQGQDNMTSGAKLTLIRESVAEAESCRALCGSISAPPAPAVRALLVPVLSLTNSSGVEVWRRGFASGVSLV